MFINRFLRASCGEIEQSRRLEKHGLGSGQRKSILDGRINGGKSPSKRPNLVTENHILCHSLDPILSMVRTARRSKRGERSLEHARQTD